MRACMCMDACVCTYGFMEVGVPHVDVKCVRAYMRRLKGRLYFLIGFMEWGE